MVLFFLFSFAFVVFFSLFPFLIDIYFDLYGLFFYYSSSHLHILALEFYLCILSPYLMSLLPLTVVPNAAVLVIVLADVTACPFW